MAEGTFSNVEAQKICARNVRNAIMTLALLRGVAVTSTRRCGNVVSLSGLTFHCLCLLTQSRIKVGQTLEDMTQLLRLTANTRIYVAVARQLASAQIRAQHILTNILIHKCKNSSNYNLVR